MINLGQIKRFIGRRLAKSEMASDRRIIIVGDSHVAAFDHAVAFKEDPRHSQVEVYRFEKQKGDVTIGDIAFEDFLDLAATLGNRDHIFSAIGGNQYAILSTVEHPMGLEVLTGPGDCNVTSGQASLIPNRIIADYIYEVVKAAVGNRLGAIMERSSASLTHLSPPPPKGDNEFISRYFEQQFAQLGMGKYGPARPELRLKMWQIQSAALERLCGELGIGFLLPPEHTVDSSGYLEPDYYAKDATHANRRYGRETLKQIVAFADAAETGPVEVAVARKVATR
jgi:hypothetical protein